MAGEHEHVLDPGATVTRLDGPHAHTLVVDGMPVTTWPGGEHQHGARDWTLLPPGDHSHDLTLPNGARSRTRPGGAHGHAEAGRSGPHTHEAEWEGVVLTTDVPAPLPRELERGLAPVAKRLPAIRDVTPEQLVALADSELQALDERLHQVAEALGQP